MTSAETIRRARKRAGLTQAQLAERLGCSQSEVGRWERGAARPTYERLQEIVAACGLHLASQMYVADDSYDPHIAQQLAMPVAERVREAAERGRYYDRLRA